MTDLLFVCPQCSKSLTIDDRGSGKVISCPECNSSIVIPKPFIFFKCPSCNLDLSAPSELAGKVRDCPNCQKELIISKGRGKGEKLICPKCFTDQFADEEFLRTIEGINVTCIKCNAAIPIPSRKPSLNPSNPSLPAKSICPKCKAPAFHNARFCQSCGEALTVNNINNIILAVHNQNKQEPPESTSNNICPYCRKEMPDNAVICIFCGTDLRTGKKISQEPTTTIPPSQYSKHNNSQVFNTSDSSAPDPAQIQQSFIGACQITFSAILLIVTFIWWYGGFDNLIGCGSKPENTVDHFMNLWKSGGSTASTILDPRCPLKQNILDFKVISFGEIQQGADFDQTIRETGEVISCSTYLVTASVKSDDEMGSFSMRIWVAKDTGKILLFAFE